MTRYTINVGFNKKGIEKLVSKIEALKKNLPLIEKKFVALSLDFIEEKAKSYLESSINRIYLPGN